MTYYAVFCFVCSVRLGAMVTGIVSIFGTAIPTLIISIKGPDWLKELADEVDSHMEEEYYQEEHFMAFLHHVQKEPQTFLTVLMSLSSVYVLTCVLEIFGAYRLSKWFLLPFIIMEAVRLITMLCFFLVVMIVVKKKINLGELIAFSCCGAFGLLLLGYFWACTLSLFRIIFVVNSPEYCIAFGENPLAALDAEPKATVRANNAAFGRVKFHESPKMAEKPFQKPNDAIENNNYHLSSWTNPTMRLQNDYNEIRNNYMKNRTFGYY